MNINSDFKVNKMVLTNTREFVPFCLIDVRQNDL